MIDEPGGPIDPAALLAEALLCIRQADEVDRELEKRADADPDNYLGGGTVRLAERRNHLIETAHALARVAEVAEVVRTMGLTTVAVVDQATPDGGSDEAPVGQYDRPEPAVYVPQPTDGLRFEAVIGDGGDGGDFHMGVVAGREWLYVQGDGYVDISHAEQVGSGVDIGYRLVGRVVSMTPTHLLGITDGGQSVAMPTGWARIRPDDQR